MNTYTKNEKINQWFDIHILKKIEAKHISIILDELSYLISTLPQKLNTEFSNEIRYMQLFIDEAKKKYALSNTQMLSNADIKVANKQLKKNIKDRYVIGFLAYRADNITLNQLRATYFFICLKLVSLDNFNSRIETTLNETRLLQKKRRFIVQFLPNLDNFTSLNELLTALNTIKASNLYQQWIGYNSEEVQEFVLNVRNHLHKDEKGIDWADEGLCNHRLSKYIYEFVLPIENIVHQKSGITRNVDSRVTKPKVIISNQYIDELTGDSTSLLSDTNLPTEEGQTEFTYETDERREDSKVAVHEVKPKKPISYHLDIVKANQQVNMRRRRSMMLLTDVQVAKDIEK